MEQIKQQKRIMESILEFLTYGISLFFFLHVMKFSIYLPMLLKSNLRYLPSYKNIYNHGDVVSEKFPVFLKILELGNEALIISLVLMFLIGFVLFVFTNDSKSKKIWKNFLITSLTVGGSLFTIFSIRGI